MTQTLIEYAHDHDIELVIGSEQITLIDLITFKVRHYGHNRLDFAVAMLHALIAEKG